MKTLVSTFETVFFLFCCREISSISDLYAKEKKKEKKSNNINVTSENVDC